MLRLVTPESIYLLAIIEQYCDGLVSARGTVPVLSFITSQLPPDVAPRHPSSDNATNKSSRLGLDVARMQVVLSESANSITSQRQDYVYTELWDGFIQRVLGLDSLDALVQFFSQLRRVFDLKAITTFRLTPSSLLGSFVRRQLFEFEKLLFNDHMKLWHDFEEYRVPLAESIWDVKDHYPNLPALDKDRGSLDKASDNEITEIIKKSIDGSTGPSKLDTDAAMFLLKFQVERMEKYGTRLPEELREELRRSIEPADAPASPMHYARFLDSWYAGDYPSAIESLHRYYDYSMMNNDRSRYQYALLKMAVLHADFGCSEEAIAAVTEAISAAREGKDMTCLTFCLHWLYHFRKSTEDSSSEKLDHSLLGSDSSALKYLVAEARKHELWPVECSAKLSEAALCLSKGHRPREAFERIYETLYLSTSHNVQSTTGSQLLLHSSVFGRLGLTSTSKAYCDLVKQCYGDIASSDDIVRTTCRAAQLISLSGSYEIAFSLLQTLEQDHSLPLKSRQYQTFCLRILKLQQALHKNDHPTIRTLLTSLTPLPNPSHYPDLTFNLDLLRIKHLTHNNSLPAALDLIESLLTARINSESADIYELILLLNAKARVFITAGRPQKGFSIAMRACKAAWVARMMGALWESVGTLGRVLNGMKCYGAARDLLVAVYWRAQESEDAELTGDLGATLAEAYVGLASQSEQNTDVMDEMLRSALEWVEAASADYTRLVDVKGIAEMDGRRELLKRVLGAGE